MAVVIPFADVAPAAAATAVLPLTQHRRQLALQGGGRTAAKDWHAAAAAAVAV
jgi:hypothetical protein